jgi:hypothetical protein
MKTSKKRIVTTILVGAIIFLALTSFFMIWYSQRYNTFFSYMDQNHDWIDDNKISIQSVDYLHGGFSIDTNYLFKARLNSQKSVHNASKHGLVKTSKFEKV